MSEGNPAVDGDGCWWAGSLLDGRTLVVHPLTFGRGRVSIVPAPCTAMQWAMACDDPIRAAMYRGYCEGW